MVVWEVVVVGDGDGWWWWLKLILVLSFGLGQAEQNLSTLQTICWGFQLRRLCHPLWEALIIFCKNKVNS